MQRDAEDPAQPAGELARSLSDPAFLAALCHDLRGPLGAIGNWLHVLRSGKADAAQQQQALAAMQRDVAAQGRLIEQLAEVSALLRGTPQPSIEVVELEPLLEELGAEVQSRQPSLEVRGDRARLRRLFALLLPAPEGAGARSGRPALSVAEQRGALLVRGLAPQGALGVVDWALARALAELQGGRLTTAAAPEGLAFTVELPGPR